MSNIIPPMVSSSPPPLDDNIDDDDDDDFGDFASANLHYDMRDAIHPSNSSIHKLSWDGEEKVEESTSPSVYEPVSHLVSPVAEILKQNGTSSRDSDPVTTDEDEEVEGQVPGVGKSSGVSGLVPELHQDNTSQDSVVSGTTDSGLCSASQNSEGTSPLPQVEDCDHLSPLRLDVSREESSESDKTLINSVVEVKRTLSPPVTLSSQLIVDKNTCLEVPESSDETVNSDKSFFCPEESSTNTETTENCTRYDATTDQMWTPDNFAGDNDDFGDFAEFREDSENVMQTDVEVPKSSSQGLDSRCRTAESEGDNVGSSYQSAAIGEVSSHFVQDQTGAELAKINNQFDEFSKHLSNSISCLEEESTSLKVLSETESDDFGGFESVVPVSEATSVNIFVEEIQCDGKKIDSRMDDIDDQFSDFTTATVADDFADFSAGVVPDSQSLFPETHISSKGATTTESGSWADITTVQTTASSFDQTDDDFDDFETADFSSSAASGDLDHNKLLSRLQNVVCTLFPSAPESHGLEERIFSLQLETSSPVWSKLKDVETSHALTYQWSGSAANKILLSALGIDSRNILFGPRWNMSVPRFAANLGFSPLEPVRASQQSSPVASEPISIPLPEVVSTAGCDEPVPAAQFDWTSSGLVNPLDCLVKDVDLANPVGASYQPHPDPLVQRILAAGSTGQSELRTELGPEAQRILDSLPDLSFLRSKMLMFPVRTPTPEHGFVE